MALNDSLDGLAEVGTELGNFLTNMGPGVAYWLVLITVVAAISGVIYAIITRIKAKM